MSILIVDDEERDRNWLKSLLVEHLANEQPFYEAHDGQQAVEMALKYKPNLIFLDIKMPQLSGIKAAEQILQQLPETGVIMLSNFSDEVYVRQLWKIMPPNGAFGYVLKNASNEQVIEAAKAVGAAATDEKLTDAIRKVAKSKPSDSLPHPSGKPVSS